MKTEIIFIVQHEKKSISYFSQQELTVIKPNSTGISFLLMEIKATSRCFLRNWVLRGLDGQKTNCVGTSKHL
jgi:hypothetical protein